MGKFGTMLQIGRTFGVRDGMLRLEYELERGSGLMSRRMRSVRGWGSWDLNIVAPGVRAQDLLAARREGKLPFFFANSAALASPLREIVELEGKQSVLAEAERVVEGRLPFFGRLSLDCGFPPRWFQNPVTAQRVPPDQPWTGLRFASRAYGDLKFILEPSRFLFVYPLVRAYVLTGDERFPQAFWNAIEDWAQRSPPMSGPLWICGQESSLRILAWSFALHAFLYSPSTTEERIALLVSMVAAHAWRTAQTLGYARSQRSNHLVSEAVGLWTAGTLYPELKNSLAWQKLGAQLLHEAVVDQITFEGVSLQHSFNYQRMVLQLLLWALRLAEIHSAHLDDAVRARANSTLDFLRAWVDPTSGHVPNYGSNDGSLILPLAHCEFGDYRPLLQLGAAVLDQPALKPGLWDEAALWFCGKSPIAEKSKSPQIPSAETGYHRLGDQNSWALVRAGLYTRRPVQADQLHVDLWWRGLNLARDAGTYLYNGEPPWNNGLSSTAVHNTVTIDGHDQMRRAGRFLWVDWSHAEGRSYLSSSSSSSSNRTQADCFEGEHDGYGHIGVKHRRMVRWLGDAGWVIVDDVLGAGEHDARLHWLLPDLPFDDSYNPFQVVLTSKNARFRWSIFASSPGTPAIVRQGKSSSPEIASEIAGADLPLLGWESPTYGELRPAVSLLYHARTQLPLRFVTVVLADDQCQIENEDGWLIISCREAELYRVTLSAGGSVVQGRPQLRMSGRTSTGLRTTS